MSDPLLPSCDDAKGKIEALERRLAHVQGQIDRKYFSDKAGQWARAEAAALKHAIHCMRYVKGLS